MVCSRCAGSRMVEIRMRIAGEGVTFHRCGRCESKLWEGAEGPMPLTRVLELARVAR